MACLTGHFCTIVISWSTPSASVTTAIVSVTLYLPAGATLLTVYDPVIVKGTMILWAIHFSCTSPSHDAAETRSPALASGLNSHSAAKSIGSVTEPRAMKRPSIFSRSFCRPS